MSYNYDPELQSLLEFLPDTSLGFNDPVKARVGFLELIALLNADVDRSGVAIENRRIPGPVGAPDIPVRIYSPEGLDKTVPGILHIHGGGFVIGDLDSELGSCIGLCRNLGVVVVSVDYRLAPEHRFPAALDDTWAVLRWLAEHADRLGLDGTRLSVGGDSAGGTLAASAALLARDAGLRLALQLLITPGTDATGAHASRHLFANGFLLDAAGIDWFFDHAIEHHHRRDWRFSPLHADDLDGVAPACVILAECDPLVDEGLAYADRLRAAGVPVQLDLVRGVTHDFIKMGRALKQAAPAQQFAAEALAQSWSKT